MVDKDGVVSILSPGPLLNDLSSDAALKNPLKGLMLSGMQLLLNAREEDLGVEFKIVTKILNREFGISDAFLYSALPGSLTFSSQPSVSTH